MPDDTLKTSFYQESNPERAGKFVNNTARRIDLIFNTQLMDGLSPKNNIDGNSLPDSREDTVVYRILDQVMNYELRCHSLADREKDTDNTLKTEVIRRFENMYDGLFNSPVDHINFCLDTIDYFRDITESYLIKGEDTKQMMLKPDYRMGKLSEYLNLIDIKLRKNKDSDKICRDKYNQIASDFSRSEDRDYLESQKQIYRDIINILGRREENIILINNTTSDYMSYKTPDFGESYMLAQLNYLDSGLKLDNEQNKVVVPLLESMENNAIKSELSSKENALDKSLNKVRPIAEALINSTLEANSNT